MAEADVARQRSPLQPRNWSQASLCDRFEHIKPYVQGKTVLDMGCASGHRREDWLHGLIRSAAARVVGVDIDQDVVRKLQASGYEVVLGDAQSVRIGQRFSVVFAGEIIEHLDDLRGFLETVKQHLEGGGRLVLTTPNVFCFTNFLYRLWGTYRTNRQHVCWFCERTIQHLLERNGFSIVEIKYVPHRSYSRARQVAARAIRALLPDRLAWNTLLVVAEPAE